MEHNNQIIETRGFGFGNFDIPDIDTEAFNFIPKEEAGLENRYNFVGDSKWGARRMDACKPKGRRIVQCDPWRKRRKLVKGAVRAVLQQQRGGAGGFSASQEQWA